MTNIQFLRETVLQPNVGHTVRTEALDRLLVACGGGEMVGSVFVPRTVVEDIRSLLRKCKKIQAVKLWRDEIKNDLKAAKFAVDCIEKEMEEEKQPD